MHIRIILGTKFQLELKNLTLLDQSYPKKVFPLEKVNNIIELCIFELF